ncbi:MAG TPA: hypothetical protein VJ954_05700, partial [Ignavibacteriaceae bacterium]|nr:hypothetical protein [Ignavibacteriaceae bacterium]
ATLDATVSISYDFTKSIFEGNFSVWTPNTTVIGVTAQMNIHIDPQNWHVLVGTPSNEIQVKILSLAGVQAYFMAGTDIPAPDPNNFPHKADIEKAIGKPLPTVHANLPKGPTEGFAFGASLSFDTGHQCFLIVCGQLSAGAGFDIALVHDPTLTCSNTGNPPGIDGWYGIGDLYAYLEGNLGLDLGFTTYTIADLGAGALCRIMVPNPTWVQGTVGGHFNVMNGAITGQFTFTFEVGQKCEISVENPLASLNWITDMQPSDGKKDVSVFAVPSVSLLFPVDQAVDLQSVDQDGNPITRTFKMEIESFTLQDGKGNTIECMPTYSDDKYIAKFTPKIDVLAGNANFTATVIVSAQEYVNGSWIQATMKDNSPAKQTQTISFTTGPRPDSLVPGQILSTYPISMQEHFLQDEIRNGRIGTRQSYIFDEPGTYVFRFVPFDSYGIKPGTVEVPCSYSNYNIGFTIPQLLNKQEYAVQVIRKVKAGIMALATKSIQTISWNSTVNNTLQNKSLYTLNNIKINTINTSNSNNTNAVQSVVLDTVGGRAQGKMPGIEIRPHEKLLYVYYFSTSEYNTLQQKIDAMAFSKTDTWTYWDNTYKAVYPHFSADEGWDDFEAHGYQEMQLDGSTVQQQPLISVYAPAPNELWYTNYVWPDIYQHIQSLIFSRDWDTSVNPLSDNFFLLLGLVNFNTTVEFAGNTTGKLIVAPVVKRSIWNSQSAFSFLTNSSPDIKLHYLHPEQIPADYFGLWLKAHALEWSYSQDNTPIPQWMQQLASIDLNHYPASYKQMYDGYYTINFIYGPKFTFDSSGPWIRKTFRLGSPVQNIYNLKKF